MPCSASCGVGTTKRYRSCQDVMGREADGCGDEKEKVEISDCFNQRCLLALMFKSQAERLAYRLKNPKRYVPASQIRPPPTAPPGTVFKTGWTGWQGWAHCDVQCGSYGTQWRKRVCQKDLLLRTYQYSKKCGPNGTPSKVSEREERSCHAGPCTLEETRQIGTWTQWAPWASCSATCGPGLQSANRTCMKGNSLGRNCDGDDFRVRDCNLYPCQHGVPPGVAWGGWSQWTTCHMTCGNMSKRWRWRYCVKDGKKTEGCNGVPSGQTRNCRVPACKFLDADRPSWTQWGSWTECTKTCGGQTGESFQERTCMLQGYPSTGCNYADPREEKTRRLKICRISQPCPKKENKPVSVASVRIAVWSTWGEWTKCSVSCGSGSRSRRRECTDANKKPTTGCSGNHLESSSCSSAPCRLVSTSVTRSNAVSWSNWSAWAKCSVSCGSGSRSRRRECTDANKKPTTGCSGNNLESSSCLSAPCRLVSTSVTRSNAVSWSNWSAWAKCSASCGSGSRSRRRECTDAMKKPSSGCKGEYVESSTCASPPCTSNSKSGTGTSAVSWTTWSKWGKCSASCGGGTSLRWRECMDTNKKLAMGCQGQYTDNNQCGTQPCKSSTISRPQPKPKAPSIDVTSIYNKWSEWQACSCADRHKKRTRTCISGKEAQCATSTMVVEETERCDPGRCDVSGQPPEAHAAPRVGKAYESAGGSIQTAEQREDVAARGGQTGEAERGEGEDGWSAWGDWEPCTVTCGMGVRMRTRHCSADDCHGDDVESEECFADQLCEDGTAISELQAEVGKGAVISCYGNYFVEDHPGSKVVWSKNEEPIKLNDRFMLKNLADLEIKQVQAEDEGIYTCAVESGDNTFTRHVVLLKINSVKGESVGKF
ncbi:A disintegrin and metalloproteinase with thrombospondin motifs adt-1-like [Lytechinus variegatus]|uniref:A disintegrin and metalloproteinase with thrombospondin motifs adt-1-like n=1 Tax=Lytechinus variegatus TaxID=7654 RepID=UPI001BB165A6|nr:A disintegrin and metalloproteinase with thrombospondin motifs adt-1-like [Lytechinus variegatus]